jgi:GH18 family chitinase
VLIRCHKSAPSCASTTDATTFVRRIAYYELFGLNRSCDVMEPEEIAAEALTHINLAFIPFDENFKIIDEQGDDVTRVVNLKSTYPGLKVFAAIGGWNFNDAPTSQYFSNMVSSSQNRQAFIASVTAYLQKYSLDGIDIGM